MDEYDVGGDGNLPEGCKLLMGGLFGEKYTAFSFMFFKKFLKWLRSGWLTAIQSFCRKLNLSDRITI